LQHVHRICIKDSLSTYRQHVLPVPAHTQKSGLVLCTVDVGAPLSYLHALFFIIYYYNKDSFFYKDSFKHTDNTSPHLQESSLVLRTVDLGAPLLCLAALHVGGNGRHPLLLAGTHFQQVGSS
jgi:hypothetical protein